MASLITLRGTNNFTIPSGASTQTITFPVTLVAGDVVIVSGTAQGTVSLSMAGAGGTWTRVINSVGVAPTTTMIIGYTLTAGSTTATLTYSTGGAGSGTTAVFSGLASGNPVIQSGSGSVSSSTTGTATLTSAVLSSSLIVAASSHFGETTLPTATWSMGSYAFADTPLSNNNSRPISFEYLLSGVAGAANNYVTYTYPNSQSGGIGIMELKAGTYTNTLSSTYFLTPTLSSTLGSNYVVKGQKDLSQLGIG
jgi:hypothetical protein